MKDDTRPEEALCAAMINLALDDVLEKIITYRHEASAEAVINHTRDGMWFFEKPQPGTLSFVFCCDVLGIDPDIVRQKLRRNWRDMISAKGKLARQMKRAEGVAA